MGAIWGFRHTNRIALLHVQPRQRFLGQNDPGGVADSDNLGCRGHEEPPRWPKYNRSYNKQRLSPVISRTSQPLVHHGVEAGVLLDEDVAEGAILAEQNGLKANQLKQCQKSS